MAGAVSGNQALDGRPVAFVDNAEDMDAYDQLPRPVRDALAYHTDNLAAGPSLKFWHDEDGRSGMDCRERLAFILKGLGA